METLEEIRQALQRLPLLQRLEVEAWLKEWELAAERSRTISRTTSRTVSRTASRTGTGDL